MKQINNQECKSKYFNIHKYVIKIYVQKVLWMFNSA